MKLSMVRTWNPVLSALDERGHLGEPAWIAEAEQLQPFQRFGAHLPAGILGKGDGEDVPKIVFRDPSGEEELHVPFGERVGLARSCRSPEHRDARQDNSGIRIQDGHAG
jgi:hypothetical protein